jgi:trk system potassium uptake protein TrkH
MHFGIIFAIFAQRSLKPLNNAVTKYYFLVILVISLIISGSLMNNGAGGSFWDNLLNSSFQTISYITTTGFGQSDTAYWPALACALLIFASIHCGCAGSTTGGIKADRMLIAGKSLRVEFRKRLSPASVFRVRMGNTILPEETISNVFLFIVLYFILIFASFVAILMCGVEVGEAFSGTIASVGNIGPGLGELGTMGNYSAQPEAAKFIYTLDMFLGRIEIFPVLIVTSMMLGRQKS